MRDRPISELIQEQQPLTLPPDALAMACEAMHRRRVGAVLVVQDGNRLQGIFTGRDAVRCLAESRDPTTTTLAEVMTHQPETVSPDQRASDALRLLSDGGFRHLPVCMDGQLQGIVSRYDFRAVEHARQNDETDFFERLR